MARRRKKTSWRRWLVWVPLAVFATPVLLIALMRWVDPVGSAFMLHRQVELWASGSRQLVRYEWIDWDYIAPVMPLAAVAAEDQRFPQHWGFDTRAIRDAWREQVNGGRVRGASTISQQVAKNLFLWSGRSWLRKGLEAYLTVAIEVLWPKRRILEVYLNIAQFGPDVFGVGAASAAYFGITPAQLGPAQAALLAGVLPSPMRYRADRPSAYVQRRAAQIQVQMRQLGMDYLRDL